MMDSAQSSLEPLNMLQNSWLVWLFGITILFMLLLDLGVLNRRSHIISNRESILWCLVWIGLAMGFSGLIYWQAGIERFSQFQSCYWIEKALSVDNLFVFILVFNFFNVPAASQHKVLFWGVVGAIVFRAIFIFSGIGIIELTYLPTFQLFGRSWSEVNVLLTAFGAFLVFAGYKSWFVADEDEEQAKDFSRSAGARLVHKMFAVSDEFDGDRFFTVANGVRTATPLLVVVSVIEFTDLLFAVDSIPAIFAIAPDDPFILYTSNIFAILGLRALYFLLANFIHMFRLLKYGLAIVLAFIGIKMIIHPVLEIPATVSLAVVGSVLVTATIASLALPARNAADAD